MIRRQLRSCSMVVVLPTILFLAQGGSHGMVRASKNIVATTASHVVVNYTLWTTPIDAASVNFLEFFKYVAIELGNSASFTPRSLVLDGTSLGCFQEESHNIHAQMWYVFDLRIYER